MSTTAVCDLTPATAHMEILDVPGPPRVLPEGGQVGGLRGDAQGHPGGLGVAGDSDPLSWQRASAVEEGASDRRGREAGS